MFKYPEGKILSILYLKNRKNVILLTSNNKILLLKIESGKIDFDYQINTFGINSMKATEDFLLYGGDQGILYFWNLNILQHVECHKLSEFAITCIELFSNFIIVAFEDFIIYFYDFNSMIEINKLRGHIRTISCMSISPDKKYLFSGSWDNNILMWSLNEFKLEFKFKGHECWVSCLQVTSDSNLLISGSGDRNIIIWDINAKSTIRKFNAHRNEIRGLSIINSEKFLTVAQDKTIAVWDITSCDLLYRADVTNCGWLTCTVIADYNRHAFIGTNNGSIIQYNLQ